MVVDRELEEGDSLELASRRLAVHLRPGHSPTDTIFVDGEARVALVGDHVLAEISPNPIVHRPLEESADPRRRPPALVRYLEEVLDHVDLLIAEGSVRELDRRLTDESGQTAGPAPSGGGRAPADRLCSRPRGARLG